MKYLCSKCKKEFNNRQSLGGHVSGHSRLGMKYGPIDKDRYKNQSCELCKSLFTTRKQSRFCSLKCAATSRSIAALKLKDQQIVYGRTRKFIAEYKESIDFCEICGKSRDQELKVARRSFAIDHDHNTNEFRGILCCACNSKLDWFVSNSSNVSSYISRPNPT